MLLPSRAVGIFTTDPAPQVGIDAPLHGGGGGVVRDFSSCLNTAAADSKLWRKKVL